MLIKLYKTVIKLRMRRRNRHKKTGVSTGMKHNSRKPDL